LLSAEVRRNIFLVVKESLHNILKHSAANDLWLEISITQGKFIMSIRDNGHGICLEKVSRFSNGLNNMKKRMADIGGALEINSKVNEGTTVGVIVEFKH
jgi:signal transduction histidine kinase